MCYSRLKPRLEIKLCSRSGHNIHCGHFFSTSKFFFATISDKNGGKISNAIPFENPPCRPKCGQQTWPTKEVESQIYETEMQCNTSLMLKKNPKEKPVSWTIQKKESAPPPMIRVDFYDYLFRQQLWLGRHPVQIVMYFLCALSYL